MADDRALTLEPISARTVSEARVMGVACLIVFMAQMATTVYLPSLPIVMRTLAMTQGGAELSISAFVIGAALPVPFWGAAANRWGRRGPLLLSLLLFVVCSLLLATCSSALELLLLRTLQGVAAGGSAIIARIVVRDNWQGDALAKRLSVLSIAFITALGVGQFIGGLIGQYSHWQVGFLLMAAAGAGATVLSWRLPLEPGRPPGSAGVGMLATYRAILARPGFRWPAVAGGLGFATTVTLQEVSPFVFKDHFGLQVSVFGDIGLLIGLAYFSGAMLVNRLVARLGGRTLLHSGAAVVGAATFAMSVLWFVGGLDGGTGLWLFIGLYCLVIFGQAVLFPNSMAIAVSDARTQGAHAMALAGFVQQGLAGIAATASILLHHGGTWTVAVLLLGGLTLLQVKLTVPRRA
jgi:predicted MFS family arabinose efflux permease